MIKVAGIIPGIGGLTQLVTPDPFQRIENGAVTQPSPSVTSALGSLSVNALPAAAEIPDKNSYNGRRQSDQHHRQSEGDFAAALKSASASVQGQRASERQAGAASDASAAPLAAKPDTDSETFTLEEAGRNHLRNAAWTAPSSPEKSASLAYIGAETGDDSLAPGLRVDWRA